MKNIALESQVQLNRKPVRARRSLLSPAAWLVLPGALLCCPDLGYAETEELGSSEKSPEIRMPVLLEPLVPEYPSNATGNARVVLRVVLDSTGVVQSLELVDGYEPFASAAKLAASGAKFSPAFKDGTAVASKITLAVDFSMQEVLEPSGPEPSSLPEDSLAEEPGVAPEQETIDIVIRAPRVDHSERVIHSAEARLTAGTFGDPLRAVELLPGITPLLSGLPYFFVRGAPPGSVSYYIDEARIPQLFHAGPGSSVMHPLFVDAVALRSGPYRARYGNATSGVVTARSVLDHSEPGAEFEAKVFESSVFVGSPFADGDGTVAAAGKHSHVGPVLALLDTNVELEYWDYQSLAAYRPTPQDQFSLLWFGASDFAGQQTDLGLDIYLDTEFHRLKLGYDRNLGDGLDVHSYVIGGLDFSRFATTRQAYRSRSLGAGSTLSFAASDVWGWSGGASVDVIDFDASGAQDSVGAAHNIAISRVDTDAAMFVENRFSPTADVQLDSGVRLSFYDSLGETQLSLEPRLSSTLELAPRFTGVLEVGYSTQAPAASVPSPAIRPAGLSGGIQKALQRAASLLYSAPLEFSAEATLFFNSYLDLSDPLSLSTVADPLNIADQPRGRPLSDESLNHDLHPSGRGYGLELLLRRPFNNRLSGSLAYTLSRSTRRIGAADALASFDRTHVLNLTGGYNLGEGYHLSTRLLAYSGLPVRVLGETGGRTGDRSDAFVRLDVRFSKQWRLSWSDLMLIVEMLNATFEQEILGVACAGPRCETAKFGPITVPSIGLRGTFGGHREGAAERASFD